MTLSSHRHPAPAYGSRICFFAKAGFCGPCLRPPHLNKSQSRSGRKRGRTILRRHPRHPQHPPIDRTEVVRSCDLRARGRVGQHKVERSRPVCGAISERPAFKERLAVACVTNAVILHTGHGADNGKGKGAGDNCTAFSSSILAQETTRDDASSRSIVHNGCGSRPRGCASGRPAGGGKNSTRQLSGATCTGRSGKARERRQFGDRAWHSCSRDARATGSGGSVFQPHPWPAGRDPHA
jgi:hypothetical protein